MQLPALPDGYTRQTAWAWHERGYTWEFIREYDRHARLDYGRSYWVLTAPDGTVQIVRYGELPGMKRPHSSTDDDFRAFSSAVSTLDDVRRWLAKAKHLPGERPSPALQPKHA